MAAGEEAALIDLAYYSMYAVFANATPRARSEKLPSLDFNEMHQLCDKLTRELGLEPVGSSRTYEAALARWKEQLQSTRQREFLEIGRLMVRLHALTTMVQTLGPPGKLLAGPMLKTKREALKRLFTKYGLTRSIDRLPGESDTWAAWSGDALRNSVFEELGQSHGRAADAAT